MAVRGLSSFSRDNLSRAERRQNEGREPKAEAPKNAKKNQPDDSAEVTEIKSNGRRRKRIQDELIESQKPKPEVPVEETQAPAEVQPPETEDPLRTLAQQFVQQFENQSGRELNTAERETKVTEVYEFYSEPSRAGRLESIVFPELAGAA